jgi:hypothetical protein
MPPSSSRRIARSTPTIGWMPALAAYWENSSAHGVLLGERHDLVDLVRAFGERIGGTDFQMDEISEGHPPLWLPYLVENEA